MSYANNNGSLSVPQYISTIDLTTETKPKFVKYFYYTVFNFAKQYTNPLILPFPITLEIIYHGDIDIGANLFSSKTFAVEEVSGSKFHISGQGTAYFWYRYGHIDPASFDLIAQTAISNKDWLVLDAILHTRSFIEAIDFLVNNPQTWTIIAEGLDWQLNEIGARDLFAYLTNNSYDTRKLAQFLTILAYIDPDVLVKVGIPVYTCDNPNKTFEKYLNYLPASPLVPIYSELSEQSSEISELFIQTSELSDDVLALMAQIVKIYYQLSEQQSEISELNIESLIHSSEITQLFFITSEQSFQISDLFTETSEIIFNLDQLSENLILFTNAGQIINNFLKMVHLFKAVLIILKILQHAVKTIAPVSELGILTDLGQLLDNILGMTSESIFYYTSELDIRGIIQTLVNLINQLLGINITLSSECCEEQEEKEKKKEKEKEKKKEKDDDDDQQNNNNNDQNGLGLGLGLNFGLNL
ncbi:hypothetical protein [Acidianus bottle-shaped virus]|uniref:Uncharacterized protein ORF470 n=1 Tax=Acidianus bottle-shaped virus (isolate Italy/Pozzuoli) TaxID=654911 RepID=Y470_ABVP|nr:hypothetical protein ABV_gp46 [Acidianus bottle-shaped virus]A4ZUD2.1 RecName: Full=Uncharacterized protein ORF470 [Acidianus bottle-shaped virus (isolate Pozzuoli)]ABP73436.1 hypothetical protein [Acidianus bottle-shaped virus]